MKFTLPRITLFTVLLSTPLCLWAEQSNNAIINDKIHQILESHHFQGTALVTRNNKPIHHHGYGMAVFEWDIPNTPTTKFRIASLSKTFTATLIMKMVDDGHLNLDNPINKYIPDIPSLYSSQITLRHLLAHRSGIPRLFNIPDWSNGLSLSSIPKKALLSKISQLPLEFKPDSRRLYSSANYVILGAIIEAVTGKPYRMVLQETILQPLGMHKTDVYQSGQLVKEIANAYKPVTGRYSFCPAVKGNFCTGNNINLALFTASGSMHSTTNELSIWLQAIEKNRLLSEASHEYLLQLDSGAAWNSQIVVLEDGKHRKMVSADGELEGNSSLLLSLPEEHISIILLNNTGMTYNQKANVALEVINFLLSLK